MARSKKERRLLTYGLDQPRFSKTKRSQSVGINSPTNDLVLVCPTFFVYKYHSCQEEVMQYTLVVFDNSVFFLFMRQLKYTYIHIDVCLYVVAGDLLGAVEG